MRSLVVRLGGVQWAVDVALCTVANVRAGACFMLLVLALMLVR